jgi:hypothetical protein
MNGVMSQIRSALFAAGAACLLSGCITVNENAKPGASPALASIAVPSCGAGLDSRRTAQLFFGRNIGGTFGVTDADWQAFVDAEITPRFPAGLSVSEVAGQWRGPNGEIVREPSKAVMIILADQPDEREKLDAIRAAYVTRFRQDAVMLIQQAACVGF